MSNKTLHSLALLAIWTLAIHVPLVSGQEGDDQVFRQAEQHFNAGRYPQARNAYQRFITLRPQDEKAAEAAFRIAESYREDTSIAQRRRLTLAIEAYELALARHPESFGAPRAYYDLARCYIDLGFIQDAIIQLRRARENYPDAPNAREVLKLLADSYYELEDFEQSAIYLESYLESYPDTSDRIAVRAKLAHSYFSQGNVTEVLQVIRQLRESVPDVLEQNPDLHYQWAESLLLAGSMDEAERAFKSMLGAVGEELKSHVRMRLGDLYRKRADTQSEDSQREAELETAIQYYLEVFRHAQQPRLVDSAVLRLTAIADELGIDVVEQYELESTDTLLNRIFQRNLDPEIRSLVLVRLARHHYLAGNIHRALEYYKLAVRDYSGTEIIEQGTGEYHRLVRTLINAAWEDGDYSAYLDFYLGYGLNLDLSTEDKIRLAISYSRVQLFDRAEALIDELRNLGIGTEQKRTLAMEMVDIAVKRKNFVVAQREIDNVLSLSPTASERERVLLKRQDIYFADRDLNKLQQYYLEHAEDFDTQRLRYSILFKLGTLHFIKGDKGESQSYLETFFSEFGSGEEGNAELYGLIKAATLTLADIYFHEEMFDEALRLYERYMFLFDRDGDIAWPLLQSGKCWRRLGSSELAVNALREFIRLYPDHYLQPQAEKAISEINTGGNNNE